MSYIAVKDNSTLSQELTEQERLDLLAIAEPSISELADAEGLLVFPQSLNEYGDEIGQQHILEANRDGFKSGNIMGFVGRGDTRLNICSRFDCGGGDYFLHYMLQRVFAVNLFDLNHGIAEDEAFDFLMYLFPSMLKNAVRQGLFKQYQTRLHNDANVKGRINTVRHIRQDIPFAGRIAYDTREYCHDNYVTQLIRHTIEHIAHHPFGSAILTGDNDTSEATGLLRQATPTYNRRERQRVIQQNLRPLAHPYYTEYRPLQRLCLQILRHDEMMYGRQDNDIYGILFDGAWLWEEYLNTILSYCGFKHPQNKKGSSPVYAFKPRSYGLYPDFYNSDIVLDAKYKRYEVNKIKREDLHQIITYMYLLKAQEGGFVFPVSSHDFQPEHNTLHGYGGTVSKYGLCVKHQSACFADYCKEMKKEEERVMQLWQV